MLATVSNRTLQLEEHAWRMTRRASRTICLPEDKKELQDMVDETLDWMDENPEADKEDYDEKQKEVEQVANPIMRNMYSGGAGGAGGDDFGDDFGDEEL